MLGNLEYAFNNQADKIRKRITGLFAAFIIVLLVFVAVFIIANFNQNRQPSGLEYISTFNADRQGVHSEFSQGIHFIKGNYIFYLHQEENVNKITMYRITY